MENRAANPHQEFPGVPPGIYIFVTGFLSSDDGDGDGDGNKSGNRRIPVYIFCFINIGLSVVSEEANKIKFLCIYLFIYYNLWIKNQRMNCKGVPDPI